MSDRNANGGKFHNILVSALVNLGDVVLTTAAVALIKEHLPNAKITMLVKSVVREAVENNPVIDEVILLDYRAKSNSFRAMRHVVKDIARRKFDLYISLDRKLRPAMLAFLARIPTRVGADKLFDEKKSRVTWFYTDTVSITHDLKRTLQCTTYKTVVRKFFGIDGDARPVMAVVSEDARQKARDMAARFADKPVALCVKGTFPLKTWPKEYFAQVVGALYRERGVKDFFVVGAKGDRPYAAEVIAAIKQEAAEVNVENFCGETSLTELMALLGESRLFLTVDTGGAHIAACADVPMVVVYGCTSPLRWHPQSDKATALWTGEACCPCSVKGTDCPSVPKPNCLYNLKPQKVIDTVLSLI